MKDPQLLKYYHGFSKLREEFDKSRQFTSTKTTMIRLMS